MSSNKWIAHVQAYRQSHPSVSYKDAMKLAKPSYKPSQKGKGAIDYDKVNQAIGKSSFAKKYHLFGMGKPQKGKGFMDNPLGIKIPNRAVYATPKVKTMPYLGGQQGKGSRLLTELPTGTLSNTYSNASKIEKI
jgi:hypothetical protein